MKIGVPVQCQNGHKGLFVFTFRGIEVTSEAPKDICNCPKWDFGEGWKACGDPFIIKETIREKMRAKLKYTKRRIL